MHGQLDKLISPAVKVRFEGFKKKFHKTYPNVTEEEKRLVIFDQNLREFYKRSPYKKSKSVNIAQDDEGFDIFLAEIDTELVK